jgi:hypothetical protein
MKQEFIEKVFSNPIVLSSPRVYHLYAGRVASVRMGRDRNDDRQVCAKLGPFDRQQKFEGDGRAAATSPLRVQLFGISRVSIILFAR